MAEENKTYFPLIAIVAIVAIVALVVLMLPARTTTPAVFTQAQPASANGLSDENIAGQAYQIMNVRSKIDSTSYNAYAVSEINDYAIKNSLDKGDYIFYRHSTQGQLTPGKIEFYSNEEYELVYPEITPIGNNLFISDKAELVNITTGENRQFTHEVCDHMASKDSSGFPVEYHVVYVGDKNVVLEKVF